MNRVYQIPMDVKQEILNTQSQFNKQMKRKIQQDGVIPRFTKGDVIFNQQIEFLYGNDKLKLAF